MVAQIKQSVMDSSTVEARRAIANALADSPIPRDELLRNLGLYLLPMELRRFLCIDSMYRQILGVPGMIFEFGCRWGQNLALLQGLRAIYEPLNHYRMIIGFDTFSGLQGVSDKDGAAPFASAGSYGVTEGYDQYLSELLRLKETQSPLPQIAKHRVIKGDAATTLEQYLKDHPETIVSFAFFDMDIYEPTAKCLRLLLRHMPRGAVVGFDQLNFADFPGETIAFQEVIGVSRVKLQRNQWCAHESFFSSLVRDSSKATTI